MSISVVWDDETQSIIRYVAEDEWTWAEFRPVLEETVRMIESVDHRVDIIADLRASGPLPRQDAFPTLKIMAAVTPDNARQGLFIVVGGGSFVKTIGNVFTRLYPGLGVPPTFVDTMDAAHARIARSRAREG